MKSVCRLLAVVLSAGAIALVVGVAPAGASSSGNSVTYQNSQGDPLAPDVSTVVVSNDDNGLLTFEIHIANRPTLAGNMEIIVFIDPGKNVNDGAGPNYEGATLGLDLYQNRVDLARWNGSKWDYSGGSPSSLVYSYANGVATINLKASDLQLSSFNFFVSTDSDATDQNSHLDFAPEAGHGSFAYDVKISPPAASPPASSPSIPTCKKGHKGTKAHPCHK